MLKSSQRKALKSLAHAKKPVVNIGKLGLTDSLLKEIEANLLAHELIKIKFQESAKDSVEDVAQKICAATHAELVESRGFVVTIYKKKPAPKKEPMK